MTTRTTTKLMRDGKYKFVNKMIKISNAGLTLALKRRFSNKRNKKKNKFA